MFPSEGKKISSTPEELIEPRKPVMKEPKPQEPVYKKAGLFNKSQVARENEQKKAAYEKQLDIYNHIVKAFNKNMQLYIKQSESYESDLKACEKNMIAIATIYDYLISERCDKLSGNDGAYNRFEDETRSNIIISKLNDIIVSPEKIQENQYMLYQKMSDIHNGINRLNTSVNQAVESLAKIWISTDDMVKLLDSIESDTATIAENTAITAKYSAVTAHYSAITSYYAKKNTELTNAPGYLVAFK